MDIAGFGALMLDQMPFEPTGQQIKLTAALARFCSKHTPSDSVFILNGYAGTGKTSVMGALVRALGQVGYRTLLLASTGRAAKVLAGFTGHPAYTIHRQIYTTSNISASGDFSSARLSPNPYSNTIFIVDEASMIGGADSIGRDLLHDLVMYVYSGVNCRLILVGDTAQLPPVGSVESPAMTADALRRMGLRVTRATITSTVRQAARSGILYNATWLRKAMATPEALPEPQLTLSPFTDVAMVVPEELEDALSTSFAKYGPDQTIVITRSNRRAVDFNRAIRQQIYDREEIIAKEDRLLIAKNNYFWPALRRRERAGQREIEDRVEMEGEKQYSGSGGRLPDFLANGEIAHVIQIYATEQIEGINFADVRLYLPDSGTEMDVKIVLDSLLADTADLPADKLNLIARHVLAQAGLTTASATAQRNALKNSPYFNALQVKYAYAVTCHKAQGGQWASVFVDMGYIPADAYRTTDFYRWLYTSVTRATTSLTFLNPACQIK